MSIRISYFCYTENLTGFEGGAVLREQNALPKSSRNTINIMAKAAIDNCRAGRAAKGANPVIRTIDKTRQVSTTCRVLTK
jgi:hypothetical protein